MKESTHIPVYEYAKKHGVSEQNVYRWIRERKFGPEDVSSEERVVIRILIREDAEPFKKKTSNETNV